VKFTPLHTLTPFSLKINFNIIFLRISNSMEQGPSSEVNDYAANQEIPNNLQNPVHILLSYFLKNHFRKGCLAITPLNYIREVSGSSLGQDTDHLHRGFPRSIGTNAGIVTKLHIERFLPETLQFIPHLSGVG
jgi:hypothetical protein